MGLPYSKQIHSAFDQVTPLVAAGFEVLRTTKNIAIFLACLQVFVALVLSLQVSPRCTFQAFSVLLQMSC